MELATLVAENIKLAGHAFDAQHDGQTDAAERYLCSALSLLNEHRELFELKPESQPPAAPPAEADAHHAI